MIIPFSSFAPDLWAGMGSQKALNCLPAEDGYIPLKSLDANTSALNERCQGAITLRDSSGVVYTFAGDDTDLWRLQSSTFNEVSSSTGAYSTGVDENWEFTQFGSTALATNYTDPIQGWTLGTSSAWSNHLTSTKKPKARHIGIVREFVVLGNTNDSTDGEVPHRVWWSAINDSADFDPAQSTMCDYQDIPDGGWVQKIVDGVEYGLVFQDYAISRMTFVGTPAVFQFDKIDRKRGTPLPGSVVGWGRHVFFISEDGFFYNDGTQSHPIGAKKVDRTFWSTMDGNNKHRVSAAVDPENKVIMWSYPSTSGDGSPDRMLFYQWDVNEWSEAEVDMEILARTMTESLTLEDLDSISTNIDTGFNVSFDSRIWMGGEFKVGAFNASHKLGYFDGTNLAATIDTKELQPVPGQRSRVSRVRPLVDGSSTTVTITPIHRAKQDTSATTGSAVSLESGSGSAAVRATDRYHRFRVITSAGDTWDRAVGVELEEFSAAGTR